uniref:Uncharacterized protein n=1 Tax=Zea mays TaxID=4577 RepID=C0PLL0_MAIZE|nr:unknown [Zea mays]
MRSAASSTVAIVCALDSSTLISKCSSRLITISTVSSESAPSSENFDSPQTSVWSGRASCFFTISQTLSVVSFLAAQETDLIGIGCRRRNVLPFLAGEKAREFVLIALTGLAKKRAEDPAMEAMCVRREGRGREAETEERRRARRA